VEKLDEFFDSQTIRIKRETTPSRKTTITAF